MSRGIDYLHSHSGIEREERNLAKDKFHVLIDEEYKHLFDDCMPDVKPFKHGHMQFYRVPTYAFFAKGGVFKNLKS